MRRPIAVGLAGAVVVGTTTLTGMTAQAEPGLEFGPCPEDVSKPHPDMRCATVTVPVNHAEPDGPKIDMLISKLPARKPDQRQGSLLVNPGGPGGPGVSFAGSLSEALPGPVRDSYDLIGFDTRNTGHSTPIHCVDPAKHWKNPLPDPDAPEMREKHWQRAEHYAQQCQKQAGKYLPHLTTPNNARDMDVIREALGEDKISYLGYSYGTYLGAVYGELFPQRVDRMILDSAVDPGTSEIWYRNNLNQNIAAQKRLGRYFDWIARYDNVFHLGTNRAQVREAWQSIQDDLRNQPHGKLGPWEFVGVTFDALYGESSWVPLAQALSAYHNDGNDQGLKDQVVPMDKAAENSNAIYNAVECADAPWPQDRRKWEHDARRIAKDHPLAAWYNQWYNATCKDWPAPSQEPMKITGADVPEVLVFNSLHDVATPYEGAKHMHESLPSSTLITAEAGKHGVYALANNPEANRIGTDYLMNGTVPQDNVTIPGHPLPNPNDPASVETAKRMIELR